MKKINLFLLLSSCVCLLCGCGKEKAVFFDSDSAAKTICPPTSVLDVTTQDKLDNIVYNSDSIIVSLNENGKIIDKNAKEIGDFVTFYKSITKAKFPVCVRVENEQTRDKFLDILTKDIESRDFTVISKDPNIIEFIKGVGVMPNIGAALDVTEKGFIDYDETRMLTNRIGANILIVSQTQSNYVDIRRTQNMAKAVWVYTNATSRANCYAALATGAIGIITSDINRYNKEINRFSYYEMKVLCRPQLSIAHRGDCHYFPVNSYEACESAIKGGAEGLELDFRMTKDKEIVVMHDSTTGSTCNNDLVVANSTLAELKELNLVMSADNVPLDPVKIPTFDEIAGLLNKYPNIILYAETKASEQEFIEVFCDKITKYNLVNRIVIINFESLVPISDYQYTRIRQFLPSLWGLDLIWAPITDETSYSFKVGRCMGYDCNVSLGTTIAGDFLEYMKDRGNLPTFWSLNENQGSIPSYIEAGVYAMTNNWASDYAHYAINFEITEKIEDTDPREIYNCRVTLYDGSTVDTYATIVASDEKDVVFYVNYVNNNDKYTHLFSVSLGGDKK